ncbi:MAG: tRNA (N6-isopentenyl adenosine(37)-C2)-methylthiotransferase MiaB [Acidobacteria bacterium]|nr:tRNA (N6-isopentenyl adenosine(37)-C2)-methylthiotransferase MiaB [Acidobacteriota bacterium]
MKFYVRTYGCQMNVADSNEMGRHLKARGLVETLDPDDASVMLVNTCTVRQHAEDRAFSEIGRLKRWKAKKSGRKVVVTGCAAERTKEYLEDRFPFVDLVVGAKSIEDFAGLTRNLLDRRETDEELDYAAPAIDEKIAAFVTIMRGCNYSCTYCIVPYVRGREIYHSMDQILGEVRDRVREGAREITLLGQTVNSYRSGQSRFAGLLRAVAEVDGVDRIRFISPHPYYMSDRVIETMATVPEVCEGLHLPVQSGSNTMLKQMARNYTREQYVSLVHKMRSVMPNMTISTDIIVGFPGETDEDFRATLSLIEEVQFDWGFIFKYSSREGTPAAKLEDLPQELIEERHQECLAMLDRIALEKRSKLVGTIQDVLVEEDNVGRTRTNYKVYVEGNVAPGEHVRVRIKDAQRATLEGEIEDVNVNFENFRQEENRSGASR